jgi:hypothetical protein
VAVGGGEGDGAFGIDGHREAAGHGLIAGRRAGDEEADGEGAAVEAMVRDDRSVAKPDFFLGDKAGAVELDFALQDFAVGI